MLANLTLTEKLAALSALSLAIAIARIVGFFAVTDITLIGLLEMRDVVALSFYVSPLAMLSIAFSLLIFRERKIPLAKFDFAASPQKDERSFEEIEVHVKRLVFQVRLMKAAVWATFLIISLLSIPVLYYFESFQVAFYFLYFGILLLCIWAALDWHKFDIPYLYIVLLTSVAFSFGKGLQDGQKAAGNPAPSHTIAIDGGEFAAYVSLVTQTSVLITTTDNVFTVIPRDRVDGIKTNSTVFGKLQKLRGELQGTSVTP